ncbi:MAG TPA: RdgB/HAM1 family non-canonical purine NTP pyrophosphatase [Kofleriaceae bacterium]|nr:RdgB/HAM1 family non-canonical purine NTP pyrophosphatase [Kofleriaceae bacterium]
MIWTFVTGNESKYREAQAILGRPLDRVKLDLPEIQAATTREVALEKAKVAYVKLGKPVIVEDAGFELPALGGFPGPFIKYWEQLGGLVSICRALDGFAARDAIAVCVLGVCDSDGARVVEGRVAGTVAREPRGTAGFGWDAIFIPEGHARTFGEMTDAEKSAISHRRRAWEALSVT